MEGKQLLTGETWSKPALIVPVDRVSVIAEWRPVQMPRDLGEERKAQMLGWLAKFEAALNDGSRELNERRGLIFIDLGASHIDKILHIPLGLPLIG